MLLRSSFLIDLSMVVAALGGPNERQRFGGGIVDEGSRHCKAMHAEKINEFRARPERGGAGRHA
jgi:hypothetical protein